MNESINENNKQETNLNDENQIKQESYESALNPNYVKESFDKLIYLYNNIEYQKFYLNEIEKSNIAKDSVDILNKSEVKNKEYEALKRKRKLKAKENKKSVKEEKIENYFCNKECLDKFKSIVNKLTSNCLSNRNRKIFQIVGLISENKNDDDEKLNKLYEFFKNEYKSS